MTSHHTGPGPGAMAEVHQRTAHRRMGVFNKNPSHCLPALKSGLRAEGVQGSRFEGLDFLVEGGVQIGDTPLISPCETDACRAS